MPKRYEVPGVYIEELTGPGVIAGVGTSMAAFVGPALCGSINEAVRISSFDEFLEKYAVLRADGSRWPFMTEPKTFYLAHAVKGFFQNGGTSAYIVRIGTGRRASVALLNQGGEAVSIIEAAQEGAAGNSISLSTQVAANQTVAIGSSSVTAVNGVSLTVSDASAFRNGDIVTKDNTARATILQIQANNLTLDVALVGLAVGDTLRIANMLTTQMTFRLVDVAGFYPGGMAILTGLNAATNLPSSERVKIQSINVQANTLTLAANPARTVNIKTDVAPANTPSLTAIRTLAVASTQITAVNSAGSELTLTSAASFKPGDTITKDNIATAVIDKIAANIVTLRTALSGVAVGDTVYIANIAPVRFTYRAVDASGLYPGGVVLIKGQDPNNPSNLLSDYGIIDTVDNAGFVTLRSAPARTASISCAVAEAQAPVLIPQEFRLVIFPPASSGRPKGRINNLSLEPFHPRYILNQTILDEIAGFDPTKQWIKVDKLAVPPVQAALPARLAALAGPANLSGGQDDHPGALAAANYQTGLDVLRDIDEVNLICVPDAAAHNDCQTIQQAMIEHCLLPQLQDRFAILDSWPNALPSGQGSIEQQRAQVQSDRGFAAIYYPWLEVRDPASSGPLPRSIFIPPSGHVAGVYARTDSERGVHKAPANVGIRGVLGLERILSDGQHGPLNLAGINALRIFPGSAQITIWGARTTVDPTINDWLYVNVRRLMIYIEESIAEGIRWAVFEPNNLALWQKLKRTINDFLTRVWRDGALFGDTAEKAFYVRIDESLNPASSRALGQLHIEIGVAPVRPAEFIIVTIGLWDGGSAISES